MPAVPIAPDLVLDSRLALVHPAGRWLAVADLHYGYEVSQRARGWLIPLWGMETIDERLRALVADHAPRTLIVAGDLVHSSLAQREAVGFVERLQALGPEVVLVRGNHDRRLRDLALVEVHQTGGYRFHHGDRPLSPLPDVTDVIGHFHPCWRYHDGAGTDLRVPALVQAEGVLVLPAFSPWAAGTPLRLDRPHRLWVCAKQRVFAVPPERRPTDRPSIPEAVVPDGINSAKTPAPSPARAPGDSGSF